MTPEEAIKHFEEDLKHVRQHLKDKDKDPEFIEDMKRWEKAEEMAIEALRQKAKPKRQCDTCRHQETCITYKEAAKDKTKWLFGCTDYEAPFATSRIEDAIRNKIWGEDDE